MAIFELVYFFTFRYLLLDIYISNLFIEKCFILATKMDVREKLVKLQKSRKRRMPINDSSELSEIQQPETNLEDVDENYEATLVKFEQGVTNLGNVALWHAGFFEVLFINFYFINFEVTVTQSTKITTTFAKVVFPRLRLSKKS